MLTAHINLGSNIGDRYDTISVAVALIRERLGEVIARSRPFHSHSWGYDSPNDYVNVGIAVALPEDTDPYQLLKELLDIQRSIDPSAHRDAEGNYTDRRIDIDLIAIDSIIINTPDLQLPHPRMHLRRFVLQPMLETAPDWRHPTLHLTPAELIDALPSDEE